MVLLQLVDGVSDAAVERIVDHLRALPSVVPGIESYEVGVDLGLAEDNARLSVIAEFADEQTYLAYRDHPEHRRVIEEQIRPVLARRSATQYDVAG